MSFWPIFVDVAARQADVPAILAPQRTPLTFGELPSRVDAVRAALNQFGLGRGDVVATALPESPEAAICLTGLMASAIAAPVNPDYAEGEFARYLARCRPKAIILRGGGADGARRQAGLLGIPIIELVPDFAGPAGAVTLTSDLRGRATRPGWNDAEDHTLILLTSGSTGQPKLVPFRLRRMVAYAGLFKDMYRMSPSDRSVQVMPLFHGHGLMSLLLTPLLLGSGTVCPGPFSVPTFFACMDEFKPTWLSGGYSILHAILDQVEKYGDIVKASRLRFIRSGSGRLDPRIMRGLEKAFDAPVCERYGGTESGVLTYTPLPPAVRKPGKVGITTVNEVKIIDEKGVFLGPNQEGEIVGRGPTVFDGYWDDPEATAASFIGDWYRTGDLGKFDEDGYLTITGRLKDVINRGGEKISPSEVDAVLTEHPAVSKACVFGVPHPTLGEEIAAAVVLRENMSASENEVLTHLRSQLVLFKIPRRILFCADLPKNTAGKILRANVAQMCLATLAQSKAETSGDSPRESSPLEQQVLAIWNKVLKTNMTDIEQDFFLAGGDSLRAADLIARVRKTFGIMLGLGQIFDEATTVAGISRLVDVARSGADFASKALPGLVPIKKSGDHPSLFAVPGNGGNPVGFVHLGRQLDRRLPLYGLESLGLDGAKPPLQSFEEIAAEHIRCIRALQPEGPYYLTGACFGARIAFEMACQLEMAGERVGLLIMLDPSPPFTDGHGRRRGEHAGARRPGTSATLLRFLKERIVLYAQHAGRMKGPERHAYLRRKLSLLRESIRQRDLFRGDRSELHQRAVHEANLYAGQRYIPRTYEGETILCITRNRPIGGDRDYRLDWMEVLPRCRGPVYIEGADSSTMMDMRNAPELARRIEGWLESARHKTVASTTRVVELVTG